MPHVLAAIRKMWHPSRTIPPRSKGDCPIERASCRNLRPVQRVFISKEASNCFFHSDIFACSYFCIPNVLAMSKPFLLFLQSINERHRMTSTHGKNMLSPDEIIAITAGILVFACFALLIHHRYHHRQGMPNQQQ